MEYGSGIWKYMMEYGKRALKSAENEQKQSYSRICVKRAPQLLHQPTYGPRAAVCPPRVSSSSLVCHRGWRTHMPCGEAATALLPAGVIKAYTDEPSTSAAGDLSPPAVPPPSLPPIEPAIVTLVHRLVGGVVS